MRRFMAATIIRHKSITTRLDEAGMIARLMFWIDTTFGSLPFLGLILAAIIIAILL